MRLAWWLAHLGASPGLSKLPQSFVARPGHPSPWGHQDLSVKSDTSADGSNTVTSGGQMAGQARDARHGKHSFCNEGRLDCVREPDRAKSVRGQVPVR